MTAPPELGRQEGAIHLPKPAGMGKALWFPKLSPTNPAVVKWLANMCQTNWRNPLSIEKSTHQLRGIHKALKSQVQVSGKSSLPSSGRLSLRTSG